MVCFIDLTATFAGQLDLWKKKTPQQTDLLVGSGENKKVEIPPQKTLNAATTSKLQYIIFCLDIEVSFHTNHLNKFKYTLCHVHTHIY